MQRLDKIRILVLIWSVSELFVKATRGKHHKSWYVGRVPPSKFEYDTLNGYYTTSKAKTVCENDLQCGGFTFKGNRNIKGIKEIYFFHFVNDDKYSLMAYMKYPHWTTYIVGSRDYVVVSCKYVADSGKYLKPTYE